MFVRVNPDYVLELRSASGINQEISSEKAQPFALSGWKGYGCKMKLGEMRNLQQFSIRPDSFMERISKE